MRYIAEHCYWAQVVVLLMYLDFDVVEKGFVQVMYLGRAPRTKGTLPNFLKWRRITRHPLVFRGLTGSQRTPGFGASQKWATNAMIIRRESFLDLGEKVSV